MDNGYYGDPRRCPRHPNVVISSPDGAYDAPCGRCEAAMDAGDPDEVDSGGYAPYYPPVDDGEDVPF